MVNAFLAQPVNSNRSTDDFIASLVDGEGLKGVGGFSLICGNIGEPLAVISNRTPTVKGTAWIAKDKDETIGLSNDAFANRSWPKVRRGEELLSSIIKSNVADRGSQASLVEDMFQLLREDTMPKRLAGRGWNSYLGELRNSIFIPPIGGDGPDNMSAEDLAAARSQHVVIEEVKRPDKNDGQSGVYGTQKQTVVLVDHHGKVTFVERALYDATGMATATSDRDRTFNFDVEGWTKI